VGVTAYLLLVPWAGIRGASIGFVLGEMVVALAAFKMSPEAARDVWDNPPLKAALAGTIVMAASMIIALRLHVRPLLASVVGVLLYVIVCGWQIRARILSEMQRAD
jgi:hypothetical protein